MPPRSVETCVELFVVLTVQRSLDVRQFRQVGLAQHQADIRIGDKKAIAVDDVSLAFFADLDARHDVPDELEVDLGNRYRAVVVAGTKRDGHVGLGFLAKVHRSEPGLPALRTAKRGFLRAVLARTDAVHAQPRHSDLLVPGRVELRDIGDFRSLAQQLEEFDAAHLDVACVELGQRSIGELALDLPDVLLDARRCRERLLVLQARQRRLVVLIGEIEADGAGGEQGAGDQRQDVEKILAKQPTAVRTPGSGGRLGGDSRRDRDLPSVAGGRVRGPELPGSVSRSDMWHHFTRAC